MFSNLLLQKKLDIEFNWKEIDKTRKLNRLLTLDMELSRRCNFKCSYCYSSADNVSPLSNELSFEEICDIIAESQSLGAQKVVIVGGGEPSIYPNIREVIDTIVQRGVTVTMYTNGAGITKSFAKFLYSRQVSVFVKLNSRRPEVQNKLCGVKNAYSTITKALDNLRSVGYPGKNYLLGIATVICEDNYEEIPEIWSWARSNGIVPYIEIITPQGRATKENSSESVEGLKRVFNELARIDKEEFALNWPGCHPPLAGSSCLRHFYSCYVRADGLVQPCAGVDLTVGDLRKESLGQILHSSTVLADTRNLDQCVEGNCATCQWKSRCYGCRGTAYQMTGNYLAEDPLCWVNTG